MAHRRRTREHWRRLVEDWPGSGLTQVQFCERHRISVASLHRWREVFRQDSGIDAVEADAQADGLVRLLPVEVCGQTPPQGGGTPLSVVLDGGVRVEVAPGFDAPTLARVVAVLQGHART